MGIFGKKRKPDEGQAMRAVVASQEDLDIAATLAIGAISVGISQRQQITDLIVKVLPTCRLEDRNFAVRVAAECLSGHGLPHMHQKGVEVDDLPPRGKSEALEAFTELQAIRAELEGLKADVALFQYELLRGRLFEGRYYDDVESLMSPLAASEVIWRFGEALQNPPTHLSPYHSEEDIGVPKVALLPAMKISYLHRHDDSEWCEHLKNGTVLIAHVVEAELFDQVLEQVGDADPFGHPAYRELVQRSPPEMEAIMQDWAIYCEKIYRKLAEATNDEPAPEA